MVNACAAGFFMPVGGGMPRLKTELLLREMEALRRRRPNPPADMFDNPATPRALSLDAQRVWFALSKGGPATAWALLAMCIGLDIDAIEAALVECQSGGVARPNDGKGTRPDGAPCAIWEAFP